MLYRHEPPVQLEKSKLIEVLAEKIVRDLDQPTGDAEAREQMLERRPLVRFVLERLIPVLHRPRPAGRRV